MTDHVGFSGQVIVIRCKEPIKGAVLENVSVRWLDQRAFLVGQLADPGKGSDPRIGLTFWFPVDEVEMLTEYPDIKAARAAYAAHAKSTADKVPRRSSWRFWE